MALNALLPNPITGTNTIDPITNLLQKLIALSIIVGLFIYAYFVGVIAIKVHRLNQSLKIESAGNPAPLVYFNLGLILFVLLLAMFTLLI